MNTGVLTLVPSPIDEESPLEPVALQLLQHACLDFEQHLFLLEPPKEARRRWLRFGLPREAIEHFIYFNEQTQLELEDEMIAELKRGKNIFLMSDGGLPAFCDPGQSLVSRCHREKIKVTSTPFANSVLLAFALCGYETKRFCFEGFLPSRGVERKEALAKVLKRKELTILMDTPYRLSQLLRELHEEQAKREVCVALDLNMKSEELLFGQAGKLAAQLEGQKREFILLLAPS
ncbi:MAG: hypothetical protein COX62_07985 [Deltaproteobacteria bacterium CG_4_10_14_0_2_um_filter_43_8]|nr:MAG: hypothetical protein COV43_03740 [Deltaproteobacteria bacterium CG11_big_fil_rev_8_21_14_0_20_42_23]PJA18843.1 MAG: hypothetical protein COX62_07985 [Deltaproteobacteria bacterium CG_4_10_14_0_2_um_filter_43_8]PJC64770.1 MAG: hypothetical protein CO021_02535 [Deltaproteobacteria bacterium CG_4_9_14_0_2_um_filter_42_21]